MNFAQYAAVYNKKTKKELQKYVLLHEKEFRKNILEAISRNAGQLDSPLVIYLTYPVEPEGWTKLVKRFKSPEEDTREFSLGFEHELVEVFWNYLEEEDCFGADSIDSITFGYTKTKTTNPYIEVVFNC